MAYYSTGDITRSIPVLLSLHFYFIHSKFILPSHQNHHAIDVSGTGYELPTNEWTTMEETNVNMLVFIIYSKAVGYFGYEAAEEGGAVPQWSKQSTPCTINDQAY